MKSLKEGKLGAPKICRSVSGLIRSVKKNENAILKVYDIMKNDHSPGGAYLNLGGNKFAGVGKDNWDAIKKHVMVIKD